MGQQQNLQLQGLEGNSWLAENAAAQESGLGNEAQNSLLSGASSELQTGALEQQLQQEELNVPEEQFLQQQAFPYQATDYLAGLVEGAAPGEAGAHELRADRAVGGPLTCCPSALRTGGKAES